MFCLKTHHNNSVDLHYWLQEEEAKAGSSLSELIQKKFPSFISITIFTIVVEQEKKLSMYFLFFEIAILNEHSITKNRQKYVYCHKIAV